MSGTDTGSVKWILEGGGVKIEITGTIVGNQIKLEYKLVQGSADLNGLFIDYDNNGGSITSIGTKSNNMNGSDTDGDALNGFDAAEVLGTVGGNDADDTEGTVFFDLPAGMTLQQLALAEIGIRATSVGEDREGSLKLADTGTYCPPEEEKDSFPDFDKEISHVILVFNTTEGDTSGDGYFTVKIDNWKGGNDLDDELDAILAYLIDEGLIDADTELLGAQIKGGNVGTAAGSYDDFWANDGDNASVTVVIPKTNGPGTTTEVISNDTVPNGLDVSQGNQASVDTTILYDTVFA